MHCEFICQCKWLVHGLTDATWAVTLPLLTDAIVPLMVKQYCMWCVGLCNSVQCWPLLRWIKTVRL